MEKKQERLSSGISGLDEMLGGGFFAGRNYLVIGEPGTGKTTFCTQFVFEGFLRNEKAVLITLDQTKNELLSDMIFFGWDFVDKQAEGLLTILDFYDIFSLEPSINITIGSLERGLRQVTQEGELKIDRLVIDPVSAIDIGYESKTSSRTEIFKLFRSLGEMDITTLLTSEKPYKTSFLPLEYVTSGVIVLTNFRKEESLIRILEIRKMRGTKFNEKLAPYKITEKGIEVFPDQKIF